MSIAPSEYFPGKLYLMMRSKVKSTLCAVRGLPVEYNPLAECDRPIGRRAVRRDRLRQGKLGLSVVVHADERVVQL